ncbi:MAG: hypothetical protein P8Y70_05540 [Candidatus Lokiarchaeota archaeon]
MFTLNFDPIKGLDHPKFGEINNFCMEEYDKYLDSYFQTFLQFEGDDFAKNFGEIIFGEIKSVELKDFGDSLRSYLGGI